MIKTALVLTLTVLPLAACEPSPYVVDKIDECIKMTDHTPPAVKACGEAYGHKPN